MNQIYFTPTTFPDFFQYYVIIDHHSFNLLTEVSVNFDSSSWPFSAFYVGGI